ncbi:MAG: hypothetical protein IPL39_01355 [Opitutaceae bacterium]|nr:hypothetical protein [Opitutaceae bacterium]
MQALNPHELRGRAAWIENLCGHQLSAIAALRAIVETHPDYYWGWELLCIWYGEQKDHANAFAAAERLVWLNPSGCLPYAYRAAAELGLDRRSAAKESLRLALQQEPDYIWGAQRLLGLLIEDKELVEAERLVAVVRAHAPGPAALRAELRVHLAAGRRAEVATCLRALAGAPAHHTEELNGALQSMVDAGWSELIETTTAPLLALEGTNCAVGAAWVHSWLRRHSWWQIRRVDRPGVAPALADEAWSALLNHLGDQHSLWTLRLVRLFYWRQLASNTARWGSLGYALATCKAYAATDRWLVDHAHRHDAAPWMLHNRAVALIARARWSALAATLDHALRLPPDHVRRPLLAMQSFCAARTGHHPEAERLLSAVAPEGLKTAASCCRAAAEALVLLARHPTTPPLEIAAVFERHERLAGSFAADPLTRPIRREFARAAARLDGRRWLWWKQRARQRFEAAPKPAPTHRAQEQFPIWAIVIILMLLSRIVAALTQK